MGLTTGITDETPPWMKQMFGTFAYFITMYRLIQRKPMYTYDVELDDGKLRENLQGPKFDIINCKYGPYDIIFNANTIVNDGMVDFSLKPEPYESIGEFGKEFEEYQNGGTHFFNTTNYRFSRGKFTNKNFENGELKPQIVGIDGESYKFKNFVKLEVLKEHLEIIVDLDRLYEEYTFQERKGPAKRSDPPKIMPKLVGLGVVAGAYYFRDDLARLWREYLG